MFYLNRMTLYVGNINWDMSESELQEVFAQCGSVDSAKIIKDRDSGKSKGFGFIEMSNEDEALAAIKNLDGQEVQGRNLRVSEAKARA